MINCESMHARRHHSHPHHRFVRRIGIVRVPDLPELRPELSQLRRIGAPLDPRFETAYPMASQSKWDGE